MPLISSSRPRQFSPIFGPSRDALAFGSTSAPGVPVGELHCSDRCLPPSSIPCSSPPRWVWRFATLPNRSPRCGCRPHGCHSAAPCGCILRTRWSWLVRLHSLGICPRSLLPSFALWRASRPGWGGGRSSLLPLRTTTARLEIQRSSQRPLRTTTARSEMLRLKPAVDTSIL